MARLDQIQVESEKASVSQHQPKRQHPPPSMLSPRRCSHCLSLWTMQWRAGPLGPKTLCNACGMRFKSWKAVA